jgi:colanic acid biosynthesis glycosyl transferase WcaI
VRVIPNFVDTAAIAVGPTDNPYRREHGLEGRRVVMYAGNVGFSQSLDLVVHAALALRHDQPDVTFVINGGGSARAGLQAAAADLPNLRFVDAQPPHRLGEVLAAADLHVVPLRRGLARSSVPSKLYSILAAGRPVLASVDEGTEVARTVERAGAGRAVPPDNPAAFVAGLRELLDRPPDELARMGAAGRSFVERWVSPGAVAAAYAELFAELAAARRRPGLHR